MKVGDLMSADPVAVGPDESALRALDLMVDEGVRHLPVVDEVRRVVGVISLDDLVAALPVPVSFHHHLADRDRIDVREVRVGEVMTHRPDTVLPTRSAREAARHMAVKGIGCLPVVDEARGLRGILSESDVLQAFASAEGGEQRVRAAPAAPRTERLVEALREERDRLARALAAYDQVGPGLAAMRLRCLEDALARAEKDELQTCVRCRGTISARRLRALPGTTLCHRCARETEW